MRRRRLPWRLRSRLGGEISNILLLVRVGSHLCLRQFVVVAAAVLTVVTLAGCTTQDTSDRGDFPPGGDDLEEPGVPSFGQRLPEGAMLVAVGELDGQSGDEQVVLTETGRLVSNGLEGRADVWDIESSWFDHQARLEIVQLDNGVPAVVLSLPVDDAMDPPQNVYQVFVVESGGFRRVLNRYIPMASGPNGEPALEFRGDGRVQYVEEPWSACQRAGFPPNPVPLLRVTLGQDTMGELVETGYEETGDAWDCSRLAG